MFFYIQAGLALLGILLILCGQIRVGERSISRSIVSAIGGALIAPFILCNLLNLGSRLSAAYSVRTGAGPWEQVVDVEQPLDMSLLDPAITIMALLVVGGLVYLGLSTSGELPYPMEFSEAPQETPAEVELVANLVDPISPDFSDAPVKPTAKDGITASRPRTMVTASPPSTPPGGTVNPPEWNAAMEKLNSPRGSN